jgi:hypothetical protein
MSRKSTINISFTQSLPTFTTHTKKTEFNKAKKNSDQLI